MKVLHILDHSIPVSDGYAFRSLNIIREQQKRGWDPFVITSSNHEQDCGGGYCRKEYIEGLRYYRSGFLRPGKTKVLDELKLIKTLTRRVAKVVDDEKPALIHAHSPVLNGIPALWAGRRQRIPVVYEIRAFWEDAGVDQGSYIENSTKYNLVKLLETQVCRLADQVTVICAGLKKDLIARGVHERKITPVYNGINADDFEWNAFDQEMFTEWRLNGKKVVAFIGSFYRYEGLDLLVKAFQILASKRSDVNLLLVGGGEMEAELKRLVLALDHGSELSDRIIMPGRIHHKRISGVYGLCDVMVYPRHKIRLTELVTPLKPLEAMAMKKTVVASDVGGHRELIKHNENGLLFSAGNVEALSDLLERTLADDALRQTLSSRANAWVREHHNWERTTSVYEDVYRRALLRSGKNSQYFVES